MTPVVWMTGVSVASAVAAVGLAGGEHGAAILAGMFGPLAAAVASWTLAERTFRRGPERLTGLMMKAFAAKAVFFAAYVAVALKTLGLARAPFMASFTAYFVGLYLAEAFWLRRLFARAPRA